MHKEWNFAHCKSLLNLLARRGSLTESQISKILKLKSDATRKLIVELESNSYVRSSIEAISNSGMPDSQYNILLKGAEYLNKLGIESTTRRLNIALVLATVVSAVCVVLNFVLFIQTHFP